MIDTLNISEDFYSVQCEGISTGVPAYFIRLANCNLFCGSNQKVLNQLRKGEAGEEVLKIEKNATWLCDTIPVWLRGEEKPFQYIFQRWKYFGIYEFIRRGVVHVIWTGGEPCLPKNQEAIAVFIEDMFKEFKHGGGGVYFEIETNGTVLITPELFWGINQINCSPKLSNSGMPVNKRLVPDVIEQIKSHRNYQFKFVISNEMDIDEMFSDFILAHDIPLDRVVCMPGMDSRKDYFASTEFILEMAKKYKFRGMTRLHIAGWDKKTGV